MKIKRQDNYRNKTELKELEGKNAFQAQLINEVGEAVIATDIAGSIIFWNKFAESLYGWKESEVLGRNIMEITPSEEMMEQAGEIMNKILNGESWSGQFIVKRRDGTKFYAQVSDSPIFNAKGEISGVLGISSDISERKRLEKILTYEKEVLELASKETSLDEILHVLIKNIQEISEKGVICSFLYLNKYKNFLLKGPAPDLPVNFTAAYDFVPVGNKGGSCGAAVFAKEEVFSPDISKDSKWKEIKGIALACGLRSCFSFPVFSSKEEVLGTFAAFYTEARNISDCDAELMRRGANIAAILIERSYNLKKIRNSEKQLKEVSSSIPGAVYQLNISTKGIVEFSFVSEGIRDLFDLVPEDIYKNVQSLYNRIFPEDIDRVNKAFEQSGKKLKPCLCEFRVVPGNNKFKWIRSHSIPTQKDNGDIIWNGTFIDVTDAHIASEAVSKSEEKYRSLVENAPDIIFQVNEAGVIKSINNTLPGYKKEKVIGTSIYEYLDESSRIIIKRGLKKSFKEGKSVFVETATNQEEKRWFSSRISPIWEKRKVVGATIISTDITEARVSQEETRKKKDELQNLLSNIPDIVARFDKQLKYIYVNKALEILTGIPVAEFIDKNYEEMGFEKSLSKFLFQKLETVFKTGKKLSFEFEFLTAKTKRFFHATLVPEKNSNEEVETVLNISRDITEIKVVENTLIQRNAELRKVNFELDRFVYSASHDLRAPLTSILGLLNLVKKEENLKEIHNYHNMIETSIIKLDEVVKEIIDYTRNARWEIVKEPVSLTNMIQDAINFFKYSMEANKIVFKTEINEDFPVFSDSKRIKIILNNLISNSIKYSDPEKKASLIRITVNSTESKIHINVDDNGIGIEKEYIGKIFQMFYRATTKSTGAGLGLFIVKETVTKLGGSIQVQSEFKEATSFMIELPNKSN